MTDTAAPLVIPTEYGPRAAFSIGETAVLLGVHPDTLRKAIGEGRVKTVELTAHTRLVPAWAIAELLADPRALPAESDPAPDSQGAQDDHEPKGRD